MSGEKEGYDCTTPKVVSAYLCNLNVVTVHCVAITYYYAILLILWHRSDLLKLHLLTAPGPYR
jgi:hypothetical protein